MQNIPSFAIHLRFHIVDNNSNLHKTIDFSSTQC